MKYYVRKYLSNVIRKSASAAFITPTIHHHIAKFALFLGLALLTGIAYADPRVGSITAANAIIGNTAQDQIGKWGVFELPSGNIVILSPDWNNLRGAVTCLTPAEYKAGGIVVTAANSLVGSAINNSVGNGRITILSNGNYVVRSPVWDNGGVTDAGAVTWVNGSTCIPFGETTRAAVVSASNSLVGLAANDKVGGGGVIALTNGNYVVASSEWDNGGIINVGAATWGNGTTGIAGTISAANSLLGSIANDQISGNGIIALTNGSYVVASGYWDSEAAVDAGAVTWGDGSTGIAGTINATNSLIGSAYSNRVGLGGVTALTNGNYVVRSPEWDNAAISNVGAVTWGSGLGGTIGLVNMANSLVGSTLDDQVGNTSITALTNGHYVVRSTRWNDGAKIQVGAVTWSNGLGGTVGVVSAANSLIGSSNYELVGSSGVVALTNGHYVVSSVNWNQGATLHVGAVTWGDGNGGTVGQISGANSLIGSAQSDAVGGSIIALSNGNYVVGSYYWNNAGIQDAGAVTWGNGLGGTVGVVSPANSLVGSSANDMVSYPRIVALTNGNYVVRSDMWNTVGVPYVGAVTWGNGMGGTVGAVSAANSLVGSTVSDLVGAGGVTPLSNGHYVVGSSGWVSAGIQGVGAITWGNGDSGTVGMVNSGNSLIGSTLYDGIGNGGIVALANGHYVVNSYDWDNGTIYEAGAVTWGNGNGGTVGVVSPSNSLVGSKNSDYFGYPDRITPLSDGSYLVNALFWDNGAKQNVGAVIWSEGGPTLPNTDPFLATIGDKTVDESSTLTFDAEATDSDLPAQNLTFSITGQPEGATFDTTTGEFSWTATEADGGQVFNVTVTVTDDGNPAGSDSEVFTITVNEVNADPVLAEVGDQTVDEGDTLTFDAEATDSDLPAQNLTFSITGQPEGATFDTATGAFSWTATEDDGGQIFNVTVTVTDDGSPEGSDSEAFTITVNEVDESDNQAPVLATIGDQTVDEGDTLTFDAEATDSDLPAQTLTFSMSGAPESASFDVNTGEFSWTATESDGGQVFNITVTVTDDGDPTGSDSESFTITVNDAETINYLNNASFENPGATNKTAAGWTTLKTTTNDQRICNTDLKPVAYEGLCAYRFQLTGTAEPERAIQRKANSIAFVKNDVLELRGMVKASNLKAGARLILKVTYGNNKLDVASVNLMPGTYDYQSFSIQLTVKRAVKKIMVQIKGGSAKGTFLIDDVALVKGSGVPLGEDVTEPDALELRGSN